MAQFVSFFHRQMIMGNAAGSATIYSDIYDVSDATMMIAELRAYAGSGGTPSNSVTGTIEQTSDSSFAATWSTYGSLSQTGVGTATSTITTAPLRYVRAKLEMAAGGFMMVHFNARANC
jgi:hypothetical protein